MVYNNVHLLGDTLNNAKKISLCTVGQEFFVVLNFRGLPEYIFLQNKFLCLRHQSPYNLCMDCKYVNFTDKTSTKNSCALPYGICVH